MRTVTEKHVIYTWNTAPTEVREKIKENLTGDGSLYDHNFQERVEVLKKVAELLNATVDYSLSVVPDRGEFIRFKPRYEELHFQGLWDTIDVEKECPLTGHCYDHDFLDHINKNNFEGTLKAACNIYIESIHDEWEHICSDESLKDLCEANEYEFRANGSIY